VTEKAPSPPAITTISRSGAAIADIDITGTYATLSWQILGASSFAGTIVKSGATSPIVLNALETNGSNILLYSLGYHTIRLTVTIPDDPFGIEYSANFRFKVEE
jgi:hypothetical protein